MSDPDPADPLINGQTSKQRRDEGLPYFPVVTELNEERLAIRRLMKEFNTNPDLEYNARIELMHKMMGSVGKDCYCEIPMRFDYGYNVHLGDRVFTNFNLVCLDVGPIYIGDNTMIGPNCSIYTVLHPLHPAQRNTGAEFMKPVTIGKNVWICGGVTVLPGVTIGDNSVIGAGAVVTRSIPANSLAMGNPCRVIREITEEDRIEGFEFPDAPY